MYSPIVQSTLVFGTLLFILNMAWKDYKEKMIYDKDIVYFIGFGFVLHTIFNPDIFIWSLGNIIVLGLIGKILHKLKVWGEGDIYLVSALGFVIPQPLQIYYGVDQSMYPIFLLGQISVGILLMMGINKLLKRKEEGVAVAPIVAGVVLLNILIGLFIHLYK